MVWQDLLGAVAEQNWQAAHGAEEELARLGPPAVALLARELQRGHERDTSALEVRQRAAWVLGQIGGEEAAAALDRELGGDDETVVRGQALLALANLPGAGPPAKLKSVMLNAAEDAGLRSSAVLLLARRAEPEGTQFLVEVLRERRCPDLDRAIIQALAFSPHAAIARAPLLDSLAHSQSAPLRGDAALSLARLLKAEAVDPLAQSLQTEAECEVRLKAVEGLGELAAVNTVSPLLLQVLQRDGEGAVRAAAAARLGISGAVGLLKPLEDALATEQDIYVRLKTVEAIAGIGGPQAVAALQRIADSEYPLRVRGQAQAELLKLR